MPTPRIHRHTFRPPEERPDPNAEQTRDPAPPPPAEPHDTYEDELAIRAEERRVIGGDAPVLGPTPNHGLAPPEPRGDVPDPTIRGLETIDPRTVRLERARVPTGYPVRPSPDHVAQGALGDCWLLAALAAVAQRNPSLIADNMRQVGPVTFRVFGELVDTDFPTIGGRPAFAAADSDSLWVALVEKRFANRSYVDLHGGWEASAFRALGLDSETLVPGKTSSRAEWTSAVVAAIHAGHPVTAGVGSDLLLGTTRLVGPHAYTVLDARVTASGVEVQLRNPWGFDPNSPDGRFWVSLDALHDSGVMITHAFAAAPAPRVRNGPTVDRRPGV